MKAKLGDEVRNLAMRAADAAKNTANLIEGTVKKASAAMGSRSPAQPTYPKKACRTHLSGISNTRCF